MNSIVVSVTRWEAKPRGDSACFLPQKCVGPAPFIQGIIAEEFFP